MSDEVHNHGLEGTESTSQSQANPSHTEVVLNIRDKRLLTELGRLQEELYATEREREPPIPNENIIVGIKKIPEIMRSNDKFKKYFTPEKWVNGKRGHSSYFYGEMHKLAAHFIWVNGSARENIFENFKTNMHGIRECFDEDIISCIGPGELTRLLFLDGCAMLGFIHGYVNQLLKGIGISEAEAGDIERDLLLVENQIPFRVLEVLIGSETDEGQENLKASMVIFIYLIHRGTFPGHSPQELSKHLEDYCFSREREKNQKAVHLLDIFRETLLFNRPSFDPFGYMLTLVRGIFWILCSCGCLAICCFLECCKRKRYNISSLLGRGAKEYFHSVQELKAAGIKFKPTHSLTTVSFRSLFFSRPQLMLPTLIVDNSTAYKLLNLVAYEMCLSNDHPKKEPWVTSYVNLLDSLVSDEQDIKDLKAADILRNALSTDTLAAELINNIGTGCIAPTEDTYMDVKQKIRKYYRTTCAVWMGQVCSTHFSNPWTIMALFAATAVLVLTFIQTWYAVNPNK